LLVSGLSLVFALLPACERKPEIAHLPETSTAAASAMDVPADPVGRFRSLLDAGQLAQARTALESVPDAEYRGFLRDQLNGAVERQIRQRAHQNPEQTLEFIRKGEEQLEIFWLEVAMAEFLVKDRDAALAWHAAQAGSLDVEGNDRVRLAIARHSLAAGDWRSAQAVKENTVNPEVRQAMAEGIGAAMEKDLRSQVRASAGETMKSLLQGGSGFETFWIEVAIHEYLAVDAKGAEKWYWTHGRSLTSEQHDRVALAYARAANQAGDGSLAKQWADQIKEEELRDVVHGEIVE
jgi:hypothetical protein